MSAAVLLMSAIVVAHAGGQAHGPENTLPTIQQSIVVGANWVEVDVRLTLDGEAVLMHDDTVDRTTDGTGPLAELTLAQTQALDAGSWFGPEFAGTPIPTLADAFGVAQGRKILVDMKDSAIGVQIADAIQVSGIPESDVVIWVTSFPELTEAQTHVPVAEVFWQFLAPSPEDITTVSSIGVDGISVLYDNLSASIVDQGHSEGMRVFVWGANSAAKITQSVALGVDGIHASDPAATLVLLSALAQDVPSLKHPMIGVLALILVVLGSIGSLDHRRREQFDRSSLMKAD